MIYIDYIVAMAINDRWYSIYYTFIILPKDITGKSENTAKMRSNISFQVRP